MVLVTTLLLRDSFALLQSALLDEIIQLEFNEYDKSVFHQTQHGNIP